VRQVTIESANPNLPIKSANSIFKSWMKGDTQEHELRDVVLALTSMVRLIFIGKQIVPLRFVSKKPLLINENMMKKTLKSWITMQALMFKHVNTPL
jgi:hypothetical protein